MRRLKEIIENARYNWGFLSDWKRAVVIYGIAKFLTKWALVVLLVRYLIANA